MTLTQWQTSRLGGPASDSSQAAATGAPGRPQVTVTRTPQLEVTPPGEACGPLTFLVKLYGIFLQVVKRGTKTPIFNLCSHRLTLTLLFCV